MTHQDLINGCFEALAGVMLWRNVLALYRAKEVRGVSVLTFSLFMLWGYWNLYYYSSLQQWWSWLAGIMVVAANTSWVLLAIYYARRARHNSLTELYQSRLGHTAMTLARNPPK